jgi:hypothetical protein
MRRSTILLSTASVLVLSAGLVLGRLSAKLPMRMHPPPEHGKGWFSDTLGLTPEQKLKMDGIWADVRQQVDKMGDRRHSLDREAFPRRQRSQPRTVAARPAGEMGSDVKGYARPRPSRSTGFARTDAEWPFNSTARGRNKALLK